MDTDRKTPLYTPEIDRKEVNDNHFYYVDGTFFPGVTTVIHETLPTPIQLKKWLGSVGTKEAERLLKIAGERGTKIHNSCEDLLRGLDANITRDYPDTNDQKCIVAFQDWFNEYKPEIRDKNDIEFVVASKHGYAGTVDILCYIEDEPWIIDIKTSRGIYESHMFQIKAYQQALFEMRGIKAKMGILHLNYRTKKGWKLEERIKVNKREVKTRDFLVILELYKIYNGGKAKSPREKIRYPDIINLYK